LRGHFRKLLRVQDLYGSVEFVRSFRLLDPIAVQLQSRVHKDLLYETRLNDPS